MISEGKLSARYAAIRASKEEQGRRSQTAEPDGGARRRSQTAEPDGEEEEEEGEGEGEEEGEEAKEEQEGEEHSPYTSPHLPIARSCGKYW